MYIIIRYDGLGTKDLGYVLGIQADYFNPRGIFLSLMTSQAIFPTLIKALADTPVHESRMKFNYFNYEIL